MGNLGKFQHPKQCGIYEYTSFAHNWRERGVVRGKPIVQPKEQHGGAFALNQAFAPNGGMAIRPHKHIAHPRLRDVWSVREIAPFPYVGEFGTFASHRTLSKWGQVIRISKKNRHYAQKGNSGRAHANSHAAARTRVVPDISSDIAHIRARARPAGRISIFPQIGAKQHRPFSDSICKQLEGHSNFP